MAAILTVLDAMIVCGIDNGALFMEETQAQRIAEDIFGSLFTSCMDITFKELDEHFKTFSDLTVAKGQIRLRPGIRNNVKALSNGCATRFALGVIRVTVLFPFTQLMISFVPTRWCTKSFNPMLKPCLKLRSPTNLKIA